MATFGRYCAVPFLSLCVSFNAVAQFDFVSMEPALDIRGEGLAETKQALARINRRILPHYRRLPGPEQEAWRGRVVSPYPGAEIPLERDFVEALFALFESPGALSDDERWELWHDAFGILLKALPGSPRVADVAKDILQADLPEVIKFIPHENVLAPALVALLETGREEDLEFVLGTERAEFWASRAAHCTMKDPGAGSLFKNEPDTAVLSLRSKAPWTLALSQPEAGVSFIQSILKKEDNAAYRSYMEWILEGAVARSEGRSPHPDAVDVVLYSDPFIESLSPSPPPTVWDTHPVLDYTHIVNLQPNLAQLFMDGAISDAVYGQCMALADMADQGYEERLKLCRDLRPLTDLPFELERWIVLQHVLLAGSLNLPDEMNSVAREWLTRYPTDWKHLPEDWREWHYHEINANVYLRGYLAHVYSRVENEQFSWPMAERLQMTREAMEPIFEFEDPEEKYVVFALKYYAGALDTLTGKWAIEQGKNLKTEAEKAAFSERALAVEESVARDMTARYDAAEAAMKSVMGKPPRTDYARGVTRNPEVLLDMVRGEKQALAGKISMVQQVRTGKQEAGVNKVAETVWQELLNAETGE